MSFKEQGEMEVEDLLRCVAYIERRNSDIEKASKGK
jgi:hypothetical protein